MYRHLLNFWLFPIFGMFFAAGATIGSDVGGGNGADGDGGGADGAGSTGDGGSGADSGGSDQQDQDDVSSQSDGDVDGSSTADGAADPNALVDLGDGRTVPSKWKKLFDQAQKSGLGKEVKQLYFATQRLAKVIPGGVNGAIQLAKEIEELGGVEGVQTLQSDLQTYSTDADLFENNQAKWVETGFQENPDAALKAFTHSIDFVADKYPDHYDHIFAKVIVNDMAALPVREIYDLLAGIKDNPKAQQAAKALADYYNSRVETARKVPEKKADAQTKALTDREKAIEEREMQTRFADVNRDVFPALKASVTKVLQSRAKTLGIDLDKLAKEYPGEWRDVLNDIHQRIMKATRKDQRFIDKHYALVKKGELKRAAKAVNDKHDSVTADAVDEAIHERGLFRGKKANTAGKDKGKDGASGSNDQAQNQGWQRVSKRPEQSTINWSKTTSGMQLDGKYILKDGKKVVVVY